MKNKKLFIANRLDNIDYDEIIEQTIVATDISEAQLIANEQYGDWKITEVNMIYSRMISKNTLDG